MYSWILRTSDTSTFPVMINRNHLACKLSQDTMRTWWHSTVVGSLLSASHDRATGMWLGYVALLSQRNVTRTRLERVFRACTGIRLHSYDLAALMKKHPLSQPICYASTPYCREQLDMIFRKKKKRRKCAERHQQQILRDSCRDCLSVSKPHTPHKSWSVVNTLCISSVWACME